MSVSPAFKRSLAAQGGGRAPDQVGMTISDIVARALERLYSLAEAGVAVQKDIREPILAAASLATLTEMPETQREALYSSYTQVCRLASTLSRNSSDAIGGQPFEEALDGAEQLLKHAAESGVDVPASVTVKLLAARTALSDGSLNDAKQSDFYSSYAALSKMFGDVTAETILVGSSKKTSRYLMNYTYAIVLLTIIVAAASIFSFVADAISSRVNHDIASGNELATKLRAGLITSDGKSIDLAKFANEPCDHLKEPSSEPKIQTPESIEQLQTFAQILRRIRSDADKLDVMLGVGLIYVECDHYGNICSDPANLPPNQQQLISEFQLNPSLINLPSEVLCKIQVFQEVRNFGGNVSADYTAIFGAISAYALPIAYAVLGAMAFQLRLFADLIRKKTYNLSFAEPARLVTAVIAGAICGLFNPAQNLSLSPLAIAFLVGYGVELFFKFLDTLINAFGPNAQVTQRRSTDRSTEGSAREMTGGAITGAVAPPVAKVQPGQIIGASG